MKMHIPTIEVHGRTPDGTPYVLNHLPADNAGVFASNLDDRQRNVAKLRQKATGFAQRWQAQFPHDKIFVVES